MPEPARVPFVADKRPHLIHLGFARLLNVHGNLLWVQRTEQRGIHRLQHRFFLLEFTQHCISTDPEHPCRITNSTGVEAHVNDGLLHVRQASSVAVIEEKTPRSARGVLAQVALCTTACLAAFDDLLTVTVQTADGDESHGPLLALGRCQDETQCDINRSPSPLLEHYPKNYSTRRARWVLKARTRYRLSTVRIAPHPGLWEQAPTEGGTPRTQLEISRGCGRRTVGLSLYPREPRRAAWGSQVTTLLPLRC